MNTWLNVLATAALSSTLWVNTVASAAPDCNSRIVASPTKFPERSQLRGQAGTVSLDVAIDRSGRVASTELVQSSGYRLLDRAARESIEKDWRFDVSDCIRKDLPATQRVSIEYRNEEYR